MTIKVKVSKYANIHWYSLQELQRHGAFGLSLHTFAPELEFRVDGAVKLKLLLQRLSMEGTDRRMVAHLLRDQSVSVVLSLQKKGN